MKIYRIRQEQFLPIAMKAAWDFFSDPANLEEITPPGMRFRILHTSGQGKMYPGQLIHYRIKILPFVWVTWLTEITQMKTGEYFTDDQRKGPYALWHHQHHFRKVPGGVEMTDEVTYALPFGWLGQWAHGIFVRDQLNGIFDYRRRILEKKFKKQSTLQTVPV